MLEKGGGSRDHGEVVLMRGGQEIYDFLSRLHIQ